MNEVMITGSFDPITLGHMDIIRRSAEIFEGVAVVMFINPEKEYTFTLEERHEMMKAALKDIKGVRVDYSEGMVIDYAASHGIKTVVRGVRNSEDLEYEKRMAKFNKEKGGIETVLLIAEDTLAEISSTKAREMIKKGVPLEEIMPKEILEMAKRPF